MFVTSEITRQINDILKKERRQIFKRPRQSGCIVYSGIIGYIYRVERERKKKWKACGPTLAEFHRRRPKFDESSFQLVNTIIIESLEFLTFSFRKRFIGRRFLSSKIIP